MDNFDKVEYEQCLALLKYYDDRHLSLLKFATGISSAVPSVIFAFHKLGGTASSGYWDFVTFLSLITALSLLILFVAMVQNRLYFIYPARQVNSIRKSQFQVENAPLFQNQMYTDVNFSAFKWVSSHALMNMFVSFQISIFFGLAYFSINIEKSTNSCLVYGSLIVAVVIALIIFSVSSVYLSRKSKFHPDISIHRKTGDTPR